MRLLSGCTGVRVFLPCLLMVLLLSGCQKTRFEMVLGTVNTVAQARTSFGEPDTKTSLPDGSTRYAWVLDRMEQIPGRWVEEVVDTRNDSSGFPVEIMRRYFAPAHEERRYCTLVMEAAANGNVLRSSWEGNSCGALLHADRQDDDTLQTGGSLDSLKEGTGPVGEPWY